VLARLKAGHASRSRCPMRVHDANRQVSVSVEAVGKRTPEKRRCGHPREEPVSTHHAAVCAGPIYYPGAGSAIDRLRTLERGAWRGLGTNPSGVERVLEIGRTQSPRAHTHHACLGVGEWAGQCRRKRGVVARHPISIRGGPRLWLAARATRVILRRTWMWGGAHAGLLSITA
jgi:hypothetical protein